MAEEATINPDGSTTFESQQEEFFDEKMGNDDVPPLGEGGEEVTTTDPAVFLLIALALLAVVVIIIKKRRSQAEAADDDFFSNLDGEKFNLRLPEEVDNYYAVKAKCEENGYVPGQGLQAEAVAKNPNHPHRLLAQALMKRAIADIPLVQHIQKEAPSMNRLYSQSMCSVKQWRNYQAAEAMVSAEVDEVRAEADELEPGWSQLIWRQAMQYHGMLKARHEQEQAMVKKAKEEALAKAAEAQKKQNAEAEAKAKVLAAEKAAQDLLKEEERKKESASAFAGGGIKKGFLDGKKKK
mmetsp:Transcript_12585/g.16424  ORF Transcript_12585/g.16424 Transcript_12585/m.16424 type:complete len:295 (-) Transcript_12585:55-939(-)